MDMTLLLSEMEATVNAMASTLASMQRQATAEPRVPADPEKKTQPVVRLAEFSAPCEPDSKIKARVLARIPGLLERQEAARQAQEDARDRAALEAAREANKEVLAQVEQARRLCLSARQIIQAAPDARGRAVMGHQARPMLEAWGENMRKALAEVEARANDPAVQRAMAREEKARILAAQERISRRERRELERERQRISRQSEVVRADEAPVGKREITPEIRARVDAILATQAPAPVARAEKPAPVKPTRESRKVRRAMGSMKAQEAYARQMAARREHIARREAPVILRRQAMCGYIMDDVSANLEAQVVFHAGPMGDMGMERGLQVPPMMPGARR